MPRFVVCGTGHKPITRYWLSQAVRTDISVRENCRNEEMAVFHREPRESL